MRSPLALIAATALLPGCASPTSPLSSRSSASRLTPGQVAVVGGGGLAGALAGKELPGNAGALVGSATGLAAGALIYNAVAASADQRLAEAVEQARREERLKIMREYWRDHTETEKPPATRAAFPATLLLHYPAGNYGGINFAPRLVSEAALAEPIR